MNMKKLGLFFLCLVAGIAVSFGADKTKAKIHFEKTIHDFGNIREDGGPVTYEFTFTNTGKDPLKITSARAECGCTRPEYPREEIAPGKSGVIKVTYNPLGRPGGFTKVVTVRCSGNPGKVNLKIRGTVIPKDAPADKSLSFIDTTVNFGEISKGVKSKRSLVCYNIGNKPLSPIFKTDSECLTALLNPEVLAPGEKGILSIYLDTAKLTFTGVKHLEIKAETEGKIQAEIKVNAIVVPVKENRS